ncbi:hypothetical protein FACUT_254 [Fusarium acutatum]|uniref:Uncharacterized protein n=1 Tax=Fusarium acutatum TaxID=78861 RepID=A0A8H4P1F2_9HYPO|nr:hypothetical protein FACUT_254 [Fusarium acutatum]
MAETAECVNQKVSRNAPVCVPSRADHYPQPDPKSSKEKITRVALLSLKSLSEQDTSIVMWLKNGDDPFPYTRRRSTNENMPKVKL